MLADGSNGSGAGWVSCESCLCCLPCPVLRVAEQQDVVGSDGVACREIGKALFDPDLVALENAGIAFDSLHQRAGFTLLGGAALAETAATQSRSELVDALGRRREIVLRVKIGVHRQIDVDPIEPRHHAGKRADMLSETRHRRARRYRPVSAAGHHELRAGAKLDRRRCAARVPQLFAAAGRTLRSPDYVMLCDGRAHQVEACKVIAQIGAKSARDRFRDFNRRKLDRALSEGIAGERRHRYRTRRSSVEESLDLPITDHAVEHAGPAGTLARVEHRSHQRKNAGGPHQQPARFVRHPLQVQLGQLSFEIIVDERNCQVGRILDHPNAELSQSSTQFGPALHVD